MQRYKKKKSKENGDSNGVLGPRWYLTIPLLLDVRLPLCDEKIQVLAETRDKGVVTGTVYRQFLGLLLFEKIIRGVRPGSLRAIPGITLYGLLRVRQALHPDTRSRAGEERTRQGFQLFLRQIRLPGRERSFGLCKFIYDEKSRLENSKGEAHTDLYVRQIEENVRADDRDWQRSR